MTEPRNLPAVARSAPIPEKIQYAKALADASMLPGSYRKQPANVLLAVEMGEALGVHPFVAIQQIHVIDGKPTASAGLISALVRKAGHRLRVSGDGEKAVAEVTRSDDSGFTYRAEWTLARAVASGLVELKNGKPYKRDDKGRPMPWERYPAAMLKARAITEVARDACQEALSGVQYTPEELGAWVDADGQPTVVDMTPQPYPSGRDWPTEVDDAATVDALHQLWFESRELGEWTEDLEQQMGARAAALQAEAGQEPSAAVDTEIPA